MVVQRAETHTLHRSDDVVRVRQVVRGWAVELGFSLVDQTKVVTATSEVARNTVMYGGGGTARLEVVQDGGRRGLRVVFEDKGPGISDVEQALQDGFTSGTGLGLGLGGARRLSNDFAIESRVGEGTRVTIVRWC
jgi:serine/threonine-protein kinase RsbT